MFPISSHLITLIIFLLITKPKVALGTSITITNQCPYSIWPGILSNAGSSSLGTTGFHLPPHQSRSFQPQPGWSGRFWARTGCSFDSPTGGTCATGGCGTGQLECNGAGAAPPATLAEFTIGSGSPDFYDVSLVDGYNLPVVVEPVGGSGPCGVTGCVADLSRMCPNELRAGSEGQGCKSACDAFGRPEYCCSGEYGSPEKCRPTSYSEMFKNACPKSYSYAFDDATSTFTCSGSDYTIVFCPSLTSLKSSRESGLVVTTPTLDTSISGAEDDLKSWLSNLVKGSGSSPKSTLQMHYIIAAVIFTLQLLELVN